MNSFHCHLAGNSDKHIYKISQKVLLKLLYNIARQTHGKYAISHKKSKQGYKAEGLTEEHFSTRYITFIEVSSGHLAI